METVLFQGFSGVTFYGNLPDDGTVVYLKFDVNCSNDRWQFTFAGVASRHRF
jgi:hypothetical protein